MRRTDLRGRSNTHDPRGGDPTPRGTPPNKGGVFRKFGVFGVKMGHRTEFKGRPRLKNFVVEK